MITTHVWSLVNVVIVEPNHTNKSTLHHPKVKLIPKESQDFLIWQAANERSKRDTTTIDRPFKSVFGIINILLFFSIYDSPRRT